MIHTWAFFDVVGGGLAGVGRAGVGRAGAGRAGVGRAGTGRAGVGRAGVGRAGDGRAGVGRAGVGRAGAGRAGAGRAGWVKWAWPEGPFSPRMLVDTSGRAGCRVSPEVVGGHVWRRAPSPPVGSARSVKIKIGAHQKVSFRWEMTRNA